MYQSKLVIFVIYLYPRYIRRKIALQGVKISNLFHTDPRCGKSGGHLNVIKMCHGIDILEEILKPYRQLFINMHYLTQSIKGWLLIGSSIRQSGFQFSWHKDDYRCLKAICQFVIFVHKAASLIIITALSLVYFT